APACHKNAGLGHDAVAVHGAALSAAETIGSDSGQPPCGRLRRRRLGASTKRYVAIESSNVALPTMARFARKPARPANDNPCAWSERTIGSCQRKTLYETTPTTARGRHSRVRTR